MSEIFNQSIIFKAMITKLYFSIKSWEIIAFNARDAVRRDSCENRNFVVFLGLFFYFVFYVSFSNFRSSLMQRKLEPAHTRRMICVGLSIYWYSINKTYQLVFWEKMACDYWSFPVKQPILHVHSRLRFVSIDLLFLAILKCIKSISGFFFYPLNIHEKSLESSCMFLK